MCLLNLNFISSARNHVILYSDYGSLLLPSFFLTTLSNCKISAELCRLVLAMLFTECAIIFRYLRGLMGTFNERAEKLMDKLTDIADKKIS